MSRPRFPAILTGLVLVFFHAPLVVLILNSFNASRFGGSWEGFTWKWYDLLWKNAPIWKAFLISLKIAAAATLSSVLLGTVAALALHWYRGALQRTHGWLVGLPLLAPDVLMGISLLAIFASTGVPLGFGSIWIAHTTFCLSYVTMVMLARLQDFDFSLMEAAADLGATPCQAFRRVLLPLLWPGILGGALLAFSLSIDDFVITFFVSGAGSTTLPILVSSMMKTSRNLPVINALSTLLIAGTFLIAALSYRLSRPPQS